MSRSTSSSSSSDQTTGRGSGGITMATGKPPQPQLQQQRSLSLRSRHSSSATATGGGNAAAVLLPFDRFSSWVHSMIVVTFDIEMGQSIEAIYPSLFNFKLTAQDKLNICYLSFPDSNSGFLGDSQFHFRFKLDPNRSDFSAGGGGGPTTNNTSTPAAAHAQHHLTTSNAGIVSSSSNHNFQAANNTASNHHHFFHHHHQTSSIRANHHVLFNYKEYNNKTPVSLEVDEHYMFGYVFFRQVKDKSLKRGYFQKSVVLLSQLPFGSLFTYILNLVASEYFVSGAQALETACQNIDQWPVLVPGETLSLPILGHLIEVAFPLQLDKYSLPLIYKKDLPSVPITLPPVHEVNLYKCLQPILFHIHLLWELILLNEPIVVIANVPSASSELVQGLVSTIWPLKYASDYRPFFTIHNSEFAEYSQKIKRPPGVIIGVTNPFFTKCLQHWPNIIKVSDSNKLAVNAQDGEILPQSSENLPSLASQLSLTDTLSSRNNSKIKKTSNIRVIDSRPAIYTQFRSYLSKDKEIIKKIIRGAESNRPLEAQSAILRRYFMDLTQNFMIPLERYFSTLMPLHKSISPLKGAPPKIREFDVDEFLRNLKQAGPELIPPLKGDWPGLYKRFFETVNFKYWYKQKIMEANKRLELIQLQLLSDYDITKWLPNRKEIEIIDQYLNIRKKLDMIADRRIECAAETGDKLSKMLETFVDALPDDMRSILAQNHQKF